MAMDAAVDRVIGGLDCMVMGAGPPLVFLPGLAPENVRPVGMMRKAEVGNLAPYARHFTTYWVGRPTGMPVGATFAEMTDVLAKALAEEFREPVNIIGTSTGGSFAQQLAAVHPELVKRMVLLSSGCRLGEHAAKTQRAMIKSAARGRPRPLLAAVAWDLVPPWRGRTAMAGVMYAGGLRVYPGARDLNDIHATLVAEDAFDLRTLPTITAPTLIINGGRDRFYEVPVIEETAALIPGSILKVFPKRGHITVVSDRRAVATAIGFLSHTA